MAIRTVLCVLGIHAFRRDLEGALQLCRSADADLKILVLSMAAPPGVGGYGEFMAEAWLEEREADRKALQAQEEAVRAALATTDVHWSVESEYCEEAGADAVIAGHAFFADLIYLGAETSAQATLRRQIIDGGLFQAPSSILIDPKYRAASLMPATILVAWTSTREAARAVRQALPLLERAGSVRVCLIDPVTAAEGDEPGAQIAAYLARHGVPVTVDVLSSAGRGIPETLVQHAGDVAADLLVMGAYGHSRLRERLWGGVTNWMIENAPLPVLMAH